MIVRRLDPATGGIQENQELIIRWNLQLSILLRDGLKFNLKFLKDLLIAIEYF